MNEPSWMIEYRRKPVTSVQRIAARLVGTALGRVYQIADEFYGADSTACSPWKQGIIRGRYDEALRNLHALATWDQELEQKAQQGFRNHYQYAHSHPHAKRKGA